MAAAVSGPRQPRPGGVLISAAGAYGISRKPRPTG